MKFYTVSIIKWLLVALMIIEPPMLARAQTVITPPTVKADLQKTAIPDQLQKMINSYLAKVVASHSEADLAPTLTETEANFQFLNTQRIRVVTKDGSQTINPAKLQLEVAPPYIHNPFTELEYAITTTGDLVIRHKETGLYHEILGLNAKSVSIDSHFIYIVTKDGDIFGVSMKYLKGLLLQSPVPVFKLGAMHDEQKLKEGGYKIHIVTERFVPKKMSAYLTEKLRPPEGQKMYLDKGDVLIYDQNGYAIELFRQNDMMEEALAESTLTRLISLITDPDYYKSGGDIRKILSEYKGDFTVLKNKLNNPKFKKSLELEQTSTTYRDMSIKATLEGHERVEMLYNFFKNGPQRQQLIIENYLKATDADFKEAEAAAVAEHAGEDPENDPETVALTYGQKFKIRAQELGIAAKNKLENAIKPKNIIRVAGILAALGAGVAADHYTGNAGSIWATSLMAKIWTHAPDTLQGTLMWPTIHATGMVMLALPLINMMAWLGSIHTGWDYKRTLITACLRTYGILAGSLYVTSQALRQFNFFPAIRAGQNPFNHPEMFNSPFASDETILKKRGVLEEKYRRDHRMHAFWWLVAHAHLMKSEKIDPLSLLAYELDLAEKKRAGVAVPNEKENLDDWAEIAQELHEFFRNKTDFDYKGDLRNITRDELMIYLAQAENVERDIKTRPESAKKIRELKSRFGHIWRHTVPEVAGAAGFDFFQQIMNIKATHTISDQFHRKMTWYTLLGDAILSVYGDRANIAKMGDLISSPTGVLGVNPAYWLQQADTLSDNLVVMPAELTLTLDEGQREKLYLPELPKGQMQEAKITETTGKFFKTFFNFRKMDLGNINKVRVVTTAMTLPAVFIMGYAFRVISHIFLNTPQNFVDAIPAQIYTIFMSILVSGWIDLASDRGVTLTQQGSTSEYLVFRDIQVKLEQALARNDLEAAKEAYNKMANEYKKRDKESDLPANADDFIKQARALLDVSYSSPAAPPLANRKVLSLITAITVIGVTLKSISFQVDAYGANPHWWRTALESLAYTGAFVGGGLLVQNKIINPIWEKFERLRSKNNEMEKESALQGRKRSFSSWCRQWLGEI